MSELRLIGRRSHLEDIQQQIYHCLSGQPRVLLVEGLAGIGKTRFLEEVQAIAEQQGMDVYTGSCDETLTEPYEPFTRLLPRLENEPALEKRELVLLQQYFGASVQTRSTLTFNVRRASHVELLITVSRGLIRLADSQPLLVVVENLHVADPSSLDLFEYLVFALTEQRSSSVLLVGSHRPVAADTLAGRLLNRLRHEDIIHKLELSGLDEPETRAFLQSLGVTRPTQQLVQAIHEATHGIPLFIQEAVHHALRTGALYARGGYLAVRQNVVATLQLPSDISDTIADRMNTLPADCQETLTLASLLGDTFEGERLAIFEPRHRVSADVALETAIEKGVLRREDHQYRFVHTLIRHAFASRLSLQQRQRLHLDMAQALERAEAAHPMSHTLEIAHHLLEAGELVDGQTLLQHAREAGDQAFVRCAWSQAARYYEGALSANPSGPDRAILHHQAGLSYYYNQDVGPAVAHFEQAKLAHEAAGDWPSLAWSLIYLVRLHFMHATVPIGVLPPYTEALEAVLSALDDTHLVLQGHVMTVLSQAYRHARQPAQGVALAETALSIGRRQNDPYLCAQAGESLGLSHLGNLQAAPAITSWQTSLHAAQEADDLMLKSFPLTNLPHALNLQGALEEGEARAREGVELTRKLQLWGERSKALSHLTSIAAAKGDFRSVEQHARDTMAMVERSHYPWGGFRALGALAGALAARGLWKEANQALDTLVEPGRVFAAPGRVEQVFTRVFRQVIIGYQNRYLTERVVPLCDDLMQVASHDTYSLAPLCAMTELGDITLMPDVAARPAAMLKVAWEWGVVLTSGWNFLIPRALGLAATMQEAWEEAAAYFEQAITIATYINALPELGRTYLDYANLVAHSPETEDFSAVADYLRQARWILYERHMIPHARHAAEYLEKLFPQIPPDDGDISRNGPPPTTEL